MSRRNRGDSDFSVDVVKVLRSEEMDGGNRIDLMVVKWGRAGTRTLEKRQVWTRPDGEVRFRKAKGLTTDDMRFVIDNLGEVMRLLQGG